MAVTPNYGALAAYLRTIGTLTLRMTFADVEAITGRLPPSSRILRQWWENDPDKAQARDGWLAAGYETASVSMKGQWLEFTRSTPRLRNKIATPARDAKPPT